MNTQVIKQRHTFRATSNFDTITKWRDANVTVEEKKDPKTNKTTFERPDVDIEVTLPEIASLLDSEAGVLFVQKLVEKQAHAIMKPFIENNQESSEWPDLTDLEFLVKSTEAPAKEAKLTATKEEMEIAADAFKQYLEAIGKVGNGADIQVELFQGKFSTARIERFLNQIIRRGVSVDSAKEYIVKMHSNVLDFIEFIKDAEEEVQKAVNVPAAICSLAIKDYLEGKQDEEEEALDLDLF